RLAVGRGLPAFREHADRLAAGVEIDEVLLDLAADDIDAGGSLDARIELALLGAVMDVEHAALARRFLREGPHRIDHVGRDGRRSQQRGAAIDLKTRQVHAKISEDDIDGGPFERPPCGNVTMEAEPESFSNRGVNRKILPENNVLTACSACPFLHARRKDHGSPEWRRKSGTAGDCRKNSRMRCPKALKNRGWRLRRPKNQPKLDESVQLD